ncbi:MAG: hypothetical protein APF76_08560 [Desulfitibacter sp. BRH_c19]|nr:MAG: hypothetical protein APF76_08560 [Desulfitibacter sp. BRH_c19]
MLDMNKLSVRLLKEFLKTVGPDVSRTQMAPNITLIDMGIKEKGSWETGKRLLEILLGGLGLINYGHFACNSYNLPSVDIYSDKPVFASLNSLLPREKNKLLVAGPGQKFLGPTTTDEVHETVFYVEYDGYEYQKDIAEIFQNSILSPLEKIFVLTASPTCLVSSAYHSSLSLALTIKAMVDCGFVHDEIMWAWGSCPILPFVDDISKAKERQNAAVLYGANVNVWVRSQDEKVTEILNGLEGAARVSFHNLASGKTFTKGKIDHERLSCLF